MDKRRLTLAGKARIAEVRAANCKKEHEDALEAYYQNPSICLYCGEVVLVAEGKDSSHPNGRRGAIGEARNKRFCTRSCSAKFNNRQRTGPSKSRKWATFVCQFCGKSEKVWGDRKRRKFCGNECKGLARRGASHPGWKGGVQIDFYLTWEWKQIRRQALERDGYKCVDCGATGCLFEVNHIKPRSLHPELRLELSNTETLCKPCHRGKKWMVHVGK